MKRNLLMGVCLLYLAALMGCETTRGAGKDIENSGKNIQDTVEKND